ncbi:hypothetical protein Taro_050039 [Colocasia esculenta]|uniref:Uncharacterized protein n=1 Tax=Colocasia esculenta TaxID=4460 RepID=A0A843XCR1_COLES|nr:hypothetical protein [Colocasia esculenta]
MYPCVNTHRWKMAALVTCICGGRRGGGSPTTLPCLFLLLSVVVPTLLLPAVAGGSEEEGATGHDAPNAAERAMGVFAPGGPWERILSWAKLTFLNLRPPDSGSRERTGKVMEAAVRSLEAGKATAEGAAKTAAQVTEATVEKTKKKVKRTLSSDSGGDAEL